MKKEDMDKDFKDWVEHVKSVLALMGRPDLWAL